MIISRIIGGLGNQMFQWAFGRSLSLEFNKDLFLDITGYVNQAGMTERKFELSNFSFLAYNTWTQEESDYIQLIHIGDNFDYETNLQKIKSTLGHNLCLNGYWQSEKYFKKHRKTIVNDFKMTYEERSKIDIIEPDSISLHVRRTDYVALSGHHPVQPMSYYSSALDIIGDYNKLYVFSDDISWCKKNLNFNRVVFVEGYSNIQDLMLMSLCKHNIIANSSFSWWGAWLNQNPDKLVVAPKQWFGAKLNLNTSDIIPEEWIKI